MGEYYPTIIIGGSQSGLSVGYHLRRLGQEFLIIEAHDRVGDAWRARWDSLRLFTPGKFDGLDGMRFPGPANAKPTKDQMADYLDAYAERFALPLRTGTRVSKITKTGDRFVVYADGERFEADNVVVATGSSQVPRVPPFAADLDPAIEQLHSSSYKAPEQLPSGPALVVGVGNSGAEIALELSRTRPTSLAGRERGHVPFDIDSFPARFLVYLVRFAGHHVISRRTPIGRKLAPKMIEHGTPLVRVKPKWLTDAGVRRVGRVAGARDGRPVLEDGTVMDVRSVVWCTGFRLDFSWIDLPVFDGSGMPVHERGIAVGEPRLAFMGLPFQLSVTSETIPGAGRDAKHVAKSIAARSAGTARTRLATGALP